MRWNKVSFLVLSFWCLNLCPALHLQAKQCICVNLICPANGKGLEVDGKVLEKELRALKIIVRRFQGHEQEDIPFADVNIFCEALRTQFFSQARLNWFIPNPELYEQCPTLLNDIDLILCRTKEIDRLFQELGCNTYYLGFTTVDARVTSLEKDFSSFIHIGGSSKRKGTLLTAEVWRNNPHFPPLTILSELREVEGMPSSVTWHFRLPYSSLRELQNRCGIHLCLSETEGFGHTILEGLSCGSVVVTVDAPPMNEFISDPRFLVPCEKKTPINLGVLYIPSLEAAENAINAVLSLNEEELREAGKANRERYLQMRSDFKKRLRTLFRSRLNNDETLKQL